MRILIIGSGGGREHALAWKLSREGHEVFAAPGNPGIAQVARVVSGSDYFAIAAAVEPDLTVVGPEAVLVTGVVDQFRAAKRPIVGPNQANAQIEGSKIHSKRLMDSLGIPTARFARVETTAEGIGALDQFDFPVVVKADGLAAGKGVIIAQDRAEAEAAVRTLGPRLIIEEFLVGEEVSFIVLCDGKVGLALEATQDHKTVNDGDTGPNTGGMGAYCDGRILSSADSEKVMATVIDPVIAATAFTGFLYAGLMMTKDGPKVLEFNVRLGDPETQPLMHRMEGGFGEVLMRAATGQLSGAKLEWKPEPSVCVVIAAAGYPGNVRTGDLIKGSENCGAEVFQAGTRMGTKGLETAGGRVLGVTASGKDLRAAVDNAYAAVGKIRFEGMHYRHDIARKGFKRWEIGTIKTSGT
jgi:phosphoribosylamine---glycine ligase